MKTNAKNLFKSMLVCMFLINMVSCNDINKKNDSETIGTTKVTVKLTDAISDTLKEVNVDIKTVALHYTYEDSTGIIIEDDTASIDNWYALNTNSGIYNLLDFSDGRDTILAIDDLPTGRINQIRLILGENNSIITSSDTIFLKVPSGMESGIKVKLDKDLISGEELILLFDFNAEKSVVLTGNGSYILKPVLKLLD